MASPFPGMNPYLEHPEFWPEVHHLLISILAETLNQQLLPQYRVAIEKRVYEISGDEALLIGIPDVTVERFRQVPVPQTTVAVALPPATPITVTVPMPMEVREGYLEVREVATRDVITVIEVLSPTNKRPGRGRGVYHEKRQSILVSQTHLVEIDLLRSGDPMPMVGTATKSDYRILVSRCDRRPQADLYAFNLQEAIPQFPLPLNLNAMEPIVNLHALLDQVYDRAGYAVAIDYHAQPMQPLQLEDAAWLTNLLTSQGFR